MEASITANNGIHFLSVFNKLIKKISAELIILAAILKSKFVDSFDSPLN